jgi:hypothetical protein
MNAFKTSAAALVTLGLAGCASTGVSSFQPNSSGLYVLTTENSLPATAQCVNGIVQDSKKSPYQQVACELIANGKYRFQTIAKLRPGQVCTDQTVISNTGRPLAIECEPFKPNNGLVGKLIAPVGAAVAAATYAGDSVGEILFGDAYVGSIGGISGGGCTYRFGKKYCPDYSNLSPVPYCPPDYRHDTGTGALSTDTYSCYEHPNAMFTGPREGRRLTY